LARKAKEEEERLQKEKEIMAREMEEINKKMLALRRMRTKSESARSLFSSSKGLKTSISRTGIQNKS
jgi:hypothetical protein